MFERYAIYHTFEGALAQRGSAWLGWDCATGTARAHPKFDGFALETMAARPRKYGFHATLMAPFHLQSNLTQGALCTALERFCSAHFAVKSQGLVVCQIGRFLALQPKGDGAQISALAAEIVKDFDLFRAPLCAQDQERRLKGRLTDRQKGNLLKWGYARVMEDFEFHVTLTGPLKEPQLSHALTGAKRYFEPVLPSEFLLGHLTLVGQCESGFFEEILRLPLMDASAH